MQSCCAPHAARTVGPPAATTDRAGLFAFSESRPRTASISNKSITFRGEGAGGCSFVEGGRYGQQQAE